MWISRLELTCFKGYQHQVFSFPEPTDGRNIVLIGGMNGYGKTSILEALYLCLYGKDAMVHLARAGLKTDDKRGYPTFLERAFNGEALRNGLDTMSVRVIINKTKTKAIDIGRKWYFRSNGNWTNEEEAVVREIARGVPDTPRQDDFSKQSAALGEARLKQSQQLAVIQDFSARAGDIATLLGEPIPEMPDDFADRMKGHLNSSREQDQLRRTLNRDRGRAQERKRNAETERTTQSTTLSNLCVAARVEAVANLPDREDDATRKRLAQATLTAHQQQLAKASIHTVDELRERLAGLDAIAIDGERERCRDEISRLEQEQVKARQAEEQTRRALEAIDASDAAAKAREAMESAAARYRSAIRPWARLKLAHALLQEALNRFRERAQAPMVAAASGYFELMTGGRYKRLVADEADDKPVLRAERADGVRIGVEAMSEGTADQLYLALRLAALELRRASHPQMPLILDDVLVTSDDERAANILRALARFAEGGQVMIFTHHRHLMDLAQVTVGEQGLVTHAL